MRTIEKLRGFVWTAFVVGAISSILFGTLELGARLALKRFFAGGTTNEFSDDDIARLYPGPRALEVRELLREHWARELWRYVPFVETGNRAFHGKFVNVQEIGYRSDVPLPWPPPPDALMLFGGSTTFGVGVGDSETIGAYLSRSLDGRPVYNFGTPAHFSTAERELFLRLAAQGIRRDSVFIDGLNDFYFFQTPDQSNFSNRLRSAAGADPVYILRRLVARLGLVQLTFRISGQNPEEIISRSAASSAEIARAAERLMTNREAEQAFCTSAGLRCVFITQPVPTFGYDNSRRPVRIDEDRADYLPAKNCRGGYAILEGRYRANQVPNHLWLANLELVEPVYVDSFHYSPETNRRLAEAIAGQLRRPRLTEPLGPNGRVEGDRSRPTPPESRDKGPRPHR